ncbi:SDR family NAD(P)-dependent oxidoreductase [Protofrankia coriariae]|uniref:Short-chain dehydrogenase n=1 Tax=Protofrankia coriariae TaxID=1562887 RepID=A0ABR5F0N4_9ACTN|nr:SDR family NAD(P)-dependent oxidoreductase [Protofrankia coriariae]KLL10243.1 short-chain dehydrogenase [Protofrankia coriariae]
MRTHDPVAGRRVLLTGACSGIGRSLATQLAAKGAHLALVARRTHLLDGLAVEISATGAAPPVVLTADLASAESATDVAHRALGELGAVDVLINNAGTSLTGALSLHSDTEAARAVFETNFWAPIALSAALIPAMRAQGRGTVVNVTSTIQSVPLPLLGYYASSKAALGQATRSLREELATTPIRVLEVIPGGTDTALRDVDELPWRGSVPKTIPPVSADSMAAAIVRALERGSKRLVYPPYALVPLELPVTGRVVAHLAGRRIDTANALPSEP